MKKHSPTQYAHALYEATNGLSSKSLEVALKTFAEILKRDRALHLSDMIMTEYEAYAKKQAGEVSLNVTSSTTLTPDHKKQLMAAFDNASKIEEVIDPSVVGGLKVRVGDTIYDATVQTQLEKLRMKMLA